MPAMFKTSCYDLESAINSMLTSVEDLKLVANQIYDGPREYSQDEIHTVLTGLATVMEAKIDETMDVFCRVFELNQYASDEKKAMREKLLAKM